MSRAILVITVQIIAVLFAAKLFAQVELQPKTGITAKLRIPSCKEFSALGSGSPSLSDPYWGTDAALVRAFGLRSTEMTNDDFSALSAAARACLGHGSCTSTSCKDALQFIERLPSFKQRDIDRQKERRIALEGERKAIELLEQKVATLSATPENKEQLKETLERLKNTPPSSPEMQNAKEALRQRIEQKIIETNSNELGQRRMRFLAAADAAARNYSPDLRALRIPPAIFDSIIYLEEQGSTPTSSKFMTLRQWTALLLDSRQWTVGAITQNENYGLALKRPGERTLTILFYADAGDLFIEGIGSGDSIERLISPVDKNIAASLVKRLVSYPSEQDVR